MTITICLSILCLSIRVIVHGGQGLGLGHVLSLEGLPIAATVPFLPWHTLNTLDADNLPRAFLTAARGTQHSVNVHIYRAVVAALIVYPRQRGGYRPQAADSLALN